MKKKLNFKIIFTSVGLTAIIATIGGFCWSLKSKSDEVESYISSNYDIKGTMVKKDKGVEDLKKSNDFLIIEVPNFRESLYEDAIYIDNIEKCEEESTPCALYQRTCAKNETEIDIEVALLNSFKEKNSNCYDVYIDIMDIANSMSREKLIEYINYFKKQLYYKDIRTVFSMTEEVYDRISGFIENDNIKILLQTKNHDFKNKCLESYMISSDDWDRNFEEATYESDKPITIYKDNNYLSISESERESVGVDISEHQGKIDFGTLKENVGYAIVRWADAYNYKNRNIIDANFDTNIKGCEDNNIKYGIYIFSRATNKEEGIEEAKVLCNDLLEKRINPNLPVFIDVESYDNDNVREALNEKDVNLLRAVEGFCDTVEEFGFTSGLYMAHSEMLQLKQIAQENDSNLFNDTILWVANWGENKVISQETVGDCNLSKIDNCLVENTYIQQITEKGKIPGIEGYVDYNKVLKRLP